MSMNYYKAKFEREQKERPTDWLIIPDDRTFGGVKLVELRNSSQKTNKRALTLAGQ